MKLIKTILFFILLVVLFTKALTSPLFNQTGFTPGSSAVESARLNKSGILDFEHSLQITQTGGDSNFCNALTLEAKRDSIVEYSGSLLTTTAPLILTGTQDDWELTISFNNPDSALMNKTCQFNIEFQASQIGGSGFTDTETVSNTISSGTWALADIVLNEFLPNPTGDDNAPMLGGEWVELYNNSASDVDVNGWYLYDSIDTHALPINSSRTSTGNTIVPAGGFLVVYRNGDSDFSLNQNVDGDTVRLYNGSISSGTLIDSHTYTGPVAENKSIARIPDGTGPWVDPVPTPGSSNCLEPEPECTPRAIIEIIPEPESTPSAVIILPPEPEATTSAKPDEILFTI